MERNYYKKTSSSSHKSTETIISFKEKNKMLTKLNILFMIAMLSIFLISGKLQLKREWLNKF